MNIDQANRTRFKSGTPHYESFFVRANHPSRPLAFWIRYTVFISQNEKTKPLSELWAIWFNGEMDQHIAIKEEYPLENSIFNSNPFSIKVGNATLEKSDLKGSAGALVWDLNYSGKDDPLLLLPEKLYEGKFPAAKSLVAQPLASFNGTFTINGEKIVIENWMGSQNHNWGRKHTDRYAWGQVAGFDNAPDTFLEVATAQLKMGPFMTPPITLILLRYGGQEIKLNALLVGLRAKGKFNYFEWHFASGKNGWSVEGTIRAHQKDFVGLRYYNPPGGIKHCLNTKIASCKLRMTKPDGVTETFTAKHRAAFEILTDNNDHGIQLGV